MNCFSSFHPLVSAFYFLSVLLITVFVAQPLLPILALLGGILFFLKIQSRIRVFRELCFSLLLFLLISLTNPLFSHNGVTPLFFLNGNPITLEAVFYGINLAIMLLAVYFWFRCFNNIMSEDKLLFLFGKLSPKIALLISSTLRFIPLFKAQAGKIRQSQKAMGLYSSDTWADKLKGTLRVYSSLISWSLENAIDTGSSMKARGYGTGKRSYYSLYKFKKSDGLFLAVITMLDTIIIGAIYSGNLDFSFYPEISAAKTDVYTVLAITAFAVLSLLPFILEIKEDVMWKYYRSRI